MLQFGHDQFFVGLSEQPTKRTGRT
uniref:Uncharacterized protein n=1 Tax=Arundo donax TaxID=35708 RepID=A0A0A8YH19_ARUDO